MLKPNISGSKIDSKDLDITLEKIRIIGTKLTKIRVSGNQTNSVIAINNLWTLHWGLNLLLKHLNQENLKFLDQHLDEINGYADRTIEEQKPEELDYLLTLLSTMEDNHGR